MKEIKNSSDELDRLFKEGLNDFQVPPPSRENGIEDNPLDQIFREELNAFEAKPSDQVWDNVKTRIPLNLRMKRQLTWWSKVAAALIIGLAATVALKEYQNSMAPVEVVSQEKEALPTEKIDSDLVLDTEPIVKSKPTTAYELIKEDEAPTVAEREAPIAPVDQLEPKIEDVASNSKNILDDQQKESEKHGDLPMRMSETKEEIITTQRNESAEKEEQEEEEKQ